MVTVAFAVLTFAGVTMIINTVIDYHRNFERTVTSVFVNDRFDMAKTGGLNGVEFYVQSEWETLCRDSQKEYYILLEGNIVASSAKGGILKITPNLRRVLDGGHSVFTDITEPLDYAVSTGEGLIVYILDTKHDLYESIGSLSFLFLQALIIGVLLAGFLSFIISKRLTASLARLEEGAKQMSAGNFTKVSVNSRDEVGRLCTVFNDMGDQIQKDFAEFERVEKSRKEFVSNVSHELKTPLTVIKSYSETLCRNDVDAATSKQFLSVIDSEVDRMTDIVGQLLKVSRLSEQVAPYSKTALNPLCADIIDTLKIESDKKRLDIILTGDAQILTDREKVVTIITNLMTNAVKYSENGGTVTVEITDGDTPSVSVTDNGIGISEADLPHVFERFYRTDKAHGRKTGGTGLGLAIALECAQAINADIKAESVLQQYTKFTLEFHNGNK